MKDKALILIGSGHNDSACRAIANLTSIKLELNGIETKAINICDSNIQECLGCDYCLEHQGECIISDDMEGVYRDINNCDYLVFISPVYFSNIPATLKKVIDRCQLYFNLRNRSSIKQKGFMAIHIGGAPSYPKQFESFLNTYEVLLNNFNANLKSFIKISNSDRVNPLKESNKELVYQGINELIK